MLYRKELIVHRRCGAEAHDVREFVQPRTPMVRWIYDKLQGQYTDPEALALGAWGWVLWNIRYPYTADGGYFDRHETLGFLQSVSQEGAMPVGQPLVRLVNSWDFWQFPAETLTYRYGDCEDTALVLVSILRNAFTEKVVRVAVGEMLRGVEWLPHAWVELVRNGETYIMDTTLKQMPSPPWQSTGVLAGEYRATHYFNDVLIEELSNG